MLPSMFLLLRFPSAAIEIKGYFYLYCIAFFYPHPTNLHINAMVPTLPDDSAKICSF